MRAAVLTAYESPLEIEDLTPIDLGETDVRVQIAASGLCHSDLSVAEGHTALGPPLIMGHEGTGLVVEVGRGVRRVAPGDRVIIALRPACGTCWYCTHDQSQFCELLATYGQAVTARRSDGTPLKPLAGIGSLAELATIPEATAIPIRSDLPSEQLALLGCGVATGIGASLNVAQIQPGQDVAVIGCGGVGQAVIQGAVIAGAARIIAIDPVALKRDTAKALGATDVIDPTEADPVEQVKELTAGRGCDIALEVIGSAAIVRQAYDMTRRGGVVVVVGMARSGEEITLPAAQFLSEGKRLLGAIYGGIQARRDLQRIIDLTEAGRLDLGALVTRRLGLDEVNAGFDAMKDGSVIRSVVLPNAADKGATP